MEESSSGVYAPQILEFVTVADQFCKHVERTSGYKPSEFLSIMQRLLPFLYVKAVNLPATEPNFEEGNERFVREEDWILIERTIASRLGLMNSFEEPFDQALHGSGEPSAGEVSEYIADIYQDLKDFLLQYRTGTEEVMNDAVWECSMHFETVWGRKLLGTVRAIHNIIYSGTDIDSQATEHGAQGAEHRDQGSGRRAQGSETDTSSWFISKRQEEYGEDD
jgi:hypothetical protein